MSSTNSSNSSIDLTEAFVKTRSRTFDLESVFTLRLSDCNLRSLHSCLNQCADLCDLDLSFNHLSSLSPLDGVKLPKLKRLNLAQNKFASLESLPILPSLEVLRLEGNSLSSSSIYSLLHERCPNLRTLWLSKPGVNGNPITQEQGYRLDVTAHLPQLEMLDGQRLKRGGGEFYTAFAQLEKATSQWADASKIKRSTELTTKPEDTAVKKLDEWLPAASWPAILPADVDSDLAPRISAVRSSLKDCARVLAEECDAQLQELEKKFKDAPGAAIANSGMRSSPTQGMEENGSFGTFGAEAED